MNKFSTWLWRTAFWLRYKVGYGLKVYGRDNFPMEGPVIVVPNHLSTRVRDFRGISATAFDGRGNYALGLKEQLIFPEIEYDQVERVTGMDIIVVTSAKTDEEARELLTQFGMPFEK